MPIPRFLPINLQCVGCFCISLFDHLIKIIPFTFILVLLTLRQIANGINQSFFWTHPLKFFSNTRFFLSLSFFFGSSCPFTCFFFYLCRQILRPFLFYTFQLTKTPKPCRCFLTDS